MRVRLAKLDEIDEISILEEKNFDATIAFDKKTLEDFYKKNKNMFYVLVDDDDRICAFTLISPIRESASEKFMIGVARDLANIELDEIISEEEEEENNKNNIKMDYYFGDIVSNKDFDSAYLLKLLKVLVNEYLPKTKFLYSTPVSNEGRKLLLLIGFEKINENEEDLHANYMIDVDGLWKSYFEGKELKRCLVGSQLRKNYKRDGK